MSEPSGDHGEFEQFRAYLLLYARSHARALATDASDLVQQAMLCAFKNRDQFHGHTPAERAVWLKQILKRQVIDAFRHQGRIKRNEQRNVPLETFVDESFSRAEVSLAAIQSSPSQKVTREEEIVRLGDTLARLPDAQREAILLHHLEGLSLEDTALRLQKTPAAVAGLLHRGLKQLRVWMEERSVRE